ncbi:MAG: glycosyltransferase family 4 protein [Promethearchaeota archaeon]
MVKILLYSPLAVENGRGGEISSMELAAGLNKYYKTTFIHTNIFIGEKLLSKMAIKAKLKGLRIRTRMKFATLKISNLVFSFPYPKDLIKLYREVKKNDIIYTSCSTFKQNLIFMFFSLIHRRGRFIIGYRKPLYSEKLFSLYNIKYRLSILFFSLFKKRFYHHTLSKSTKNFLQKFYNSKKVIHIVHGIDLKLYRDNNFQEKSKNLLNYIYIGYLDDIHKGVNVLIETLDEFLKENRDLNLKFEFCGMGPLDKKIQALERKYPKYVKFHGYINNNLVPEFYKKSDIYLFTSRVEPFPRSIMEALGAGLLVICSKTIGSVELLKGQEFAFFLKELDKSSIKRKILETYNLWKNNPERILELQKLAKNYVFKNYSSEIELHMFRDLLQKIIKNV